MYCELLSALFFAQLAVPALLALWYWRRRARRNQTVLHRPEFVRDRVYLVQFPASPHVRSISPFVLKLETWLRLNQVDYEPVYTIKFGGKGQMPYVELNGEQICDSNLIIDRLQRHFGIETYKDASAAEKSMVHAITVMIENHTSVAGFYWRYGLHMKEFADKLCKDTYPMSKRGLFIWTKVQPIVIRVRTWLHGLGRHSEQEIAEFSFKDLQAISDYLGDKPFFLGPEPQPIDCTLFGQLAQFLYIPMAFPQKAYLHSNCDNLVKYVDRVRERFWPDWDELCKKECMDGKMGVVDK